MGQLLSREVCTSFDIVPFAYVGDTLYLATPDPDNSLAVHIAEGMTGYRVVLVQAPVEQVRQGIQLIHSAAVSSSALPSSLTSPVMNAQGRRRIGELFIEHGFITEEQLQEALLEQRRTGDRLGAILVHSEMVTEQQLLAVVAEHYGMPRVDLSGHAPEPEAVATIPEKVCNQLRIVPIAVEGNVLYIASAHPLDAASLTLVAQYTALEVNTFLASGNDIDELLARIYSEEYTERARLALLNASPENSAHQVLSSGQKVFFIALAVIIVICLALWTKMTLIVLVAISSAFYLISSLYKFRLTFRALGHQYEIDITDEEVAAMDESELPVYTILVPLFKEAAIVDRLVDGIGKLDYPRTKLDVRLLCEEDHVDDETAKAIREMNLPPHFRLVQVPDSQPRTKPKACNFGIVQAQGKYVVIYDAEDRPDPDQLKKAVLAFQKADDSVTCIQAKLNYFNQNQNMLTRWFSIEYSMWFDLMLPGLDADGVPIPLGGTSNHFITERLLELGAWDPFNVTEDADLGIRLHKHGYSTSIIDSTTLEEANSDLKNWINQRSRWIKGYIQTWLVHMRNPFKLLKDVGLKSFISFNLVVGGTFIFLLNPIFWLLTTIFIFTQADIIQQLFPSFIFYIASIMLFIGNFIFMYFNVAGSMQRGDFSLTRYALLSPIYWGLMSFAAWKGFIQLFTGKAFYWEKTVHGLDKGDHS
jgi:glycosyltransferase XagB